MLSQGHILYGTQLIVGNLSCRTMTPGQSKCLQK